MNKSNFPTETQQKKGVSQELIDELSKDDNTVLTFAITKGKSIKIRINPKVWEGNLSDDIE